jgi:hypothetical protein
MFITKMVMPRRTFLRGIGATLALPLLDAMVPAATALAQTPAAPVQRAGFIYVPNGQALQNWIPTAVGANFEFTPILKPLESHRDRLVVVSGLANLEAESRGVTIGPHTRCGSVYLNGVRPKRTEGADVEAGKTLDQFAADRLGIDTPLRSLEIALESNYNVGNCENGYSCAYVNTFSWRTPTMPLPMEHNPRVVFERLFGDGETVPARRRQMRRNQSILDAMSADMMDLQRTLGPGDRVRVSEYLDVVREVERRIQKAETHVEMSPADVGAPIGIPEDYEEHASLMFDLWALAFQADVTRVVAFQIGREQSGRTYPWIGVPEADHDISHHGSDPEKTAKRTKINTYHAMLFGRFLDKLSNTPDGDGNLLDHSMILYGSGMGDGSVHSPHNLPVLIAGGACGQIKGNRHIKTAFDTPLMNLGLSMLDKIGVELTGIGDSTGRMADL